MKRIGLLSTAAAAVLLVMAAAAGCGSSSSSGGSGSTTRSSTRSVATMTADPSRCLWPKRVAAPRLPTSVVPVRKANGLLTYMVGSSVDEDLYAVPASGGRRRLLATGSDGYAWSPDGRRIALLKHHPSGEFDMGSADLYLARANGSGAASAGSSDNRRRPLRSAVLARRQSGRVHSWLFGCEGDRDSRSPLPRARLNRERRPCV
jgi:hypothetical protein